jgi:hypothetical protein
MRIELGFARTSCGCEKCRLFCQRLPGALIPSDLDRLIPSGEDPLAWSEQHLRASGGYLRLSADGVDWVPSLVPAKAPSGHCHWLAEGRCMVHADSPFGCAFLDQHMTDKEAEKRASASREARRGAFETGGLYARIWSHLAAHDLVYLTGKEDMELIGKALREIHRRDTVAAQRTQRRRAKERRKKERRAKKASKR